MKRSLKLACRAAFVVAAAAPVPAFAQAPVANSSFTGFYINAGAGYGGWTAETTGIDPVTGLCSTCVGQTQGGEGMFGTIGAGYDYQYGRHLVAGVFADGDIGHLEGTIQDQDALLAGRISQTSAIYVGARAGWLIDQSVMPFVSAGFSQATFSGTGMVPTQSTTFATHSTSGFTRTGWFVGAGVEGQISPDFFLRAEYRRADYGTVQIADNGPAAGPGGAVDTLTFHPVTQTFRLAVVYKFSHLGAQPVESAAEQAPASGNAFTGIHVGVGGGFGMWAAGTTTLSTPNVGCVLCTTQTQGGNGPLGRFEVGYDYAVLPNLIVGAFADLDLSNMKGTIQDQLPWYAGRTTQDRTFDFGARIGWVASPSFMPYGTFGFTQTHFTGASMAQTSAYSGPAGFSTPGFNRTGYFAGVGTEAKIANNWSVRGEYRYATYGRTTLSDTAAGQEPVSSITFRPTTQTFVVSAIYRFNFLNH